MKKVLAIILDGFGIREEEKGNAVKAAKMKNFEHLWKTYPHSLLEASGTYVGLNEGQFGNSEVGHMAIGAGRLVKQNEIIVNEFLETNYKENEQFLNLLNKKDKNIHIMGLGSDGNVHAGIDDFLSLFKILYENGFKNIYFHVITDGRDTGINDGVKFIELIQNKINEYKVGEIVTVSGRYYGMDRDENYDRTRAYYDLVVRGRGVGALDPVIAMKNYYSNNVTDEFMKPIILKEDKVVRNDDVIIWMNYRADRSKQILRAFKDSNFNEFPTLKMTNLEVYTFFPIDENIDSISFMEPIKVVNSLGLYLSSLGINQARISESEKFPHVTYFFDGGYDGDIDKCTKINVPSPIVETFDLKPEMSAVGVTKEACRAMEKDYDFIFMNYANPDMVGHTGNFDAAVKACMAIDVCLGKVLEVAEENFYKVIVLSDHGNAETMLLDNGEICTTHSSEPVPFIIKDEKIKLKEKGDLTMVAPTILHYMDIAAPEEMKDTPILIIEDE